MNTEEKAKRYDEALEKARMWKEKSGMPADRQGILDDIFPELRESEDERIRNWIISTLKSLNSTAVQIDGAYEMMLPAIAWLEKQGYDKVEQKFKIGDWVVFNNKHQSIYQVEKIEDGYYILRHTHGGTFRVCVLHDESLRPWTIQDAKDGDVLATGDEIFIHNGKLDLIGRVCAYCGIYKTYNELRFNYAANNYFTYIKPHPATKEQRDTLMKAMADAGYTFDFDKKELKKIVALIFKIGDTIIKKHNSDIHDFGSFTITDITGGKYWYNDRIICDITKQDEWEIYEPVKQKSAEWSEEDKNHVKSILSTIECCKAQFPNSQAVVEAYNADIEWLKSLRPQATWKPSDEQMGALLDAIVYVEGCNSNFKGSGSILENLYSDLKKLKG